VDSVQSQTITLMENRIQTYQEFWPFYLSQHSHPTSRVLHLLGTLSAVSCVGFSFLLGPQLLGLALLCGYGPAWVGHFFFEKNRPATFKYPFWSLISDFRMVAVMLRGRMPEELERYHLKNRFSVRAR
jgi:hypothetical protein